MKALFLITFLSCCSLIIGQENKGTDLKENAYYNRLDIGVFGETARYYSLNMVNGVALGHWSIGVGTGFEDYREEKYIPLFLETQYALWKKKTSPWVGINFGYLFPFDYVEVNRGGPLFESKVGINYFVFKHLGLTTSAVYRIMDLKTSLDPFGHTILHERSTQLEMRIGIVIK